jgi:antitoxin (DNA-binding transcriptional repressor) of toxin-antitoxin stability system
MNKERLKHSTIKASELNRAPGAVLRRVAVGKEQIIVERDGYPIAIISPYEVGRTQAEQLLEALTQELQPLADKLGLTEEQVIEDLRKTRKEISRRKYGKAQK